MRVFTGRWIFCLLILGIVACTYKDPEILADINNKVAKPDSHILVVGTRYIKWQWPSGISAFPNGGIPKFLEQEVRIYLCDVDDPANIQRIVMVFDPQKYRSSAPHILGWQGEAFFFRVDLSGVGEGASGTARFYKWDAAAGLAQIAKAPSPRELQRGSPKDRVFVEYDYGSTKTISVRTDRDHAWQKDLFHIDPVTGHLMGAGQGPEQK